MSLVWFLSNAFRKMGRSIVGFDTIRCLLSPELTRVARKTNWRQNNTESCVCRQTLVISCHFSHSLLLPEPVNVLLIFLFYSRHLAFDAVG